MYTISNITTPEVVSKQKLKYFTTPNILVGSISNIKRSNIEPLFVPDVRNATTQRRNKTGTSTNAVTEALALTNVAHGEEVPAIEIAYVEGDQNDVPHNHAVPGWACYPKKQPTKPLALTTLEKLHTLFVRGNDDKYRRVSADRVRAVIVEESASKEWYEQSILTEARIKAFFGMKKDKQLALITSLMNSVTNVEVQAELEELEEAEEQEEALALKETNMEDITLELEEELHICEEDETVK